MKRPASCRCAIYLSHRLVERQALLRKQGKLPWLRPDAKSQVTMRYVDGRPKEIDTVVLSTQHHPDIEHAKLTEAVIEEIVKPVLPKDMIGKKVNYLINPTGRFVVGGPQGDCGLTGRKIIVDTYGGSAPHGGGAFSGKDPSKVDRSAAYAARYVAKNIVAVGPGHQGAGAGVVRDRRRQAHQHHGRPRSAPAKCPTSGWKSWSRKHFDLRPKGIIQMLDLLRPIYQKTAAYGHFGRSEPEFTWEKTDKAELLAAEAGIKRAANG